MRRSRFLKWMGLAGLFAAVPGWLALRDLPNPPGTPGPGPRSGASGRGGGEPGGAGRSRHPAHTGGRPVTDQAFEKLEKTEEEWRRILEPRRYEILFEEETEPRHSSPLNEEEREGTYICAACFLPLFPSETKYESGTGWPSFWRPLEGRVETKRDFKLLIPRTEYHCARCEGHQGHVFEDGPEPTGLRYCNNGLALRFVPAGEEMPDLRT